MVLRHKALRVVGSRRYTPFIILSRSRTGSNLLVSLLNSHPNVYTEGEILRRLNGRNASCVISRAFGRQPWYIKAKGFKMFYYHPMDDPNSGAWDELRRVEDLRVIHLKRKNILETIVSHKLAEAQGVWLVESRRGSKSTARPMTVALTVDELASGFEQTRAWEASAENDFHGHAVLDVYYEDLVADRSSVFRRITDFLGVAYVEPKTTLRKQQSARMKQTIEDYDALKAHFSTTEWAPLFDDREPR